ncbi:hypothetical protein [Sphingomonas solaris]|uniref:Uncharacterized protein n=1 Tax=Alterirhizorhabdus solaris TaxID=2529389 RepID=A0A558QU21_9SPHN|nr:hypothetical protein [Sphingomonas solaris]TVV70567.1 hypothetical protein FOY91_18805 [Sphingomonas solaris]
MPGHFDDFIVTAQCPGCGAQVSATYGRLRCDPRVTCHCGMGFAVYLDGSPVAEADMLWDAGRWRVANDNSSPPYLVKG